MRHLVIILCGLLSAVLLSCHDGSRHEATLRWADSLNRNYIEIPSDSQLLEAVAFYDRHGTPNERMRAHYLLGCAYRDMGEAPKALETFYSAIDCADTLSSDCDYETLMRLHSQAGNLMIRQYAMPDNALLEFSKASHYASVISDTLSNLSLEAQQVNAYYEKHTFDSVLFIADKLIESSRHNRNTRVFLSTTGMLVTPIRVCLETEDYDKAQKYLFQIDFKTLFKEHQSRTLGILLGFQGEIFLQKNELDSAESCFRKSIEHNTSVTNKQFAYHGLLTLYKLRGEIDSIMVYSNLYTHYNDSSIIQLSTTDTQRAYHLYNYARNEHLAKINQAKTHRLTIIVIFLFVLIAVFCMIVYHIIKKSRKRVKQKMMQLNQRYNHYLEEYRRAINEIELLRISERSKDKYLTEKEEEVRMLQEKLHSFQPDIFNPEIWEHETTIQNSTIIIHMHKLASKGLRAGSSELSAVRQLCNTVYPSFLPKLSSLYPSLTLNQTNLCILIRLRFIPSEIASLLGNSVQAISNMRARLHKRMFHSDGSARGFNERIMAL